MTDTPDTMASHRYLPPTGTGLDCRATFDGVACGRRPDDAHHVLDYAFRPLTSGHPLDLGAIGDMPGPRLRAYGPVAARVRAERDDQITVAAQVDKMLADAWPPPGELVPTTTEQFPPIRGVRAWALAGLVVGAAVAVGALGDAAMRRLEARRAR